MTEGNGSENPEGERVVASFLFAEQAAKAAVSLTAETGVTHSVKDTGSGNFVVVTRVSPGPGK